MTTALAIGLAAISLTAVFLALRLSGMKAELTKERMTRERLEGDVRKIAGEHASYIDAKENQIGVLKNDIAQLELDLAAASKPGDIRNRLNGLLQKPAG